MKTQSVQWELANRQLREMIPTARPSMANRYMLIDGADGTTTRRCWPVGDYRRGEKRVASLDFLALTSPALHRHMDNLLEDGRIRQAPAGDGSPVWGGNQFRFIIVNPYVYEMALCHCQVTTCEKWQWGYLYMKLGSAGEWVNFMEARLEAAGYNVVDDTVYAGRERVELPEEERLHALVGLPAVPMRLRQGAHIVEIANKYPVRVRKV